jgi:hypothetical protein
MFWDNIAGVYDIFEKVINKKTNSRFVRANRKTDIRIRHGT